MGLRDSITHFVAGFFFERPVRTLSLADLADKLELEGRKLERTFAAAGDSDRNRAAVRHITGIERWSQSRLRIALGQPLVMDEYDDYRPARELDWPAMQDAFSETRRESVALARELVEANADGVEIPHNQYGDLTVRGWLQYLISHASLEAKRIR